MIYKSVYSKWALAGAALASLAILNAVALSIVGEFVMEREMLRILRQFGIGVATARPYVFMIGLGSLACGPVCILLGVEGLREIRKHPERRGKPLAQFAIAVGALPVVALLAAGLVLLVLGR